MGVRDSAMRKCVNQLKLEQQDIAPKVSPLTPAQQRIRELRKKISRSRIEEEPKRKADMFSVW